MKHLRLETMTKGWFVGDFEPTIYKTDTVEVAVKHYSAGVSEEAHFHKIATELTVIIGGKVEMNGRHYQAGDIIVMEPEEETDFRAVTDSVTVVVKIPGARNDKYLAGDPNDA